QRLRVVGEEREEEQLLLARSEAARALAQRAQVRRRRLGTRAEPFDGARERGVDRSRRLTEAAADEAAELVDERAVPVRAEHVHDRLRRDDLADRGSERRRSGVDANA